MYLRHFVSLILLFAFIGGLISSCKDPYPSVDERPKILTLIGKLQNAVKDKNAAAIDSLIIAESYQKGYSSASVLRDVYGDSETAGFYAFGGKEFYYAADEGVVNFTIMADSSDTVGRAAEVVVKKIKDDWYISKFDLK